MRILNDDPPLLHLPGPASPAFASLISRLMAKEPLQRPASAEAVGGLLEGMTSVGSPALAGSGEGPGPAGSQAITLEMASSRTAGAGRTPRASSPLRRLALGAAGLLVLIATLLGVLRLARRAAVPAGSDRASSVAVLYFDNVADPGDTDKIGAIAGHLLVTSLAQNASLEVLSTQSVLDALYRLGAKGDRVARETAMKVARALNAGRIITGSVLQVHPYIVMTSEVT